MTRKTLQEIDQETFGRKKKQSSTQPETKSPTKKEQFTQALNDAAAAIQKLQSLMQ